jgi:hypothetical protein
MLISEYCKYALAPGVVLLSRALPKEAIHDGDHQSGCEHRAVRFRSRTSTPTAQARGRSAGRSTDAARVHLRHAVASPRRRRAFRLYCNHFIRASERTGERAISIQLDGGENCMAEVSLVRLPRRKLPKASIVTAGGDPVRSRRISEDRIEFTVPASGRVVLSWQ